MYSGMSLYVIWRQAVKHDTEDVRTSVHNLTSHDIFKCNDSQLMQRQLSSPLVQFAFRTAARDLELHYSTLLDLSIKYSKNQSTIRASEGDDLMKRIFFNAESRSQAL